MFIFTVLAIVIACLSETEGACSYAMSHYTRNGVRPPNSRDNVWCTMPPSGTVKLVENTFLINRYIDFGARGAGGMCPPLFDPREAKGGGAHHFELQPLVCSGKVITLTQQCITQVTKVATNSQQDPLILELVDPSLVASLCYTGSKYRGRGI